MDGSTDCSNIEELFLAVYFDPYSEDGSVHIRNKYFCVRQPTSVDALGLQKCFSIDKMRKMVGFGCDGARVNLGEIVLRGLLEVDMPWLVTVWCFANRVELSLKDAFFSCTDEVLLRVYFLYCKSPNKCHELEEVVKEIKACLDSPEFDHGHGNRLIRACGTIFITHKVHALERFTDGFEAYINHLTSITEDSNTTSTDKQKLKCYVSKWLDCKIMLGCAFFHDILKPVSALFRVMNCALLVIQNLF